MQSPTPSPQPLPIKLQKHNNKEHRTHNRTLRPKALLRTRLLCPPNLQITDHETSKCAALIQPCANLTGALWVAVEIVARDCDGRDHYAEDVETPRQGGYHVVVSSFEAEAEEDETGDHEGCAEPDDGEACFWF